MSRTPVLCKEKIIVMFYFRLVEISMTRAGRNFYEACMGEKNKYTTSSSLQACFVVTHSSGDLMRINFTIAYIQYSLSNLCGAKLTG